jgi:hypothetical protein
LGGGVGDGIVFVARKGGAESSSSGGGGSGGFMGAGAGLAMTTAGGGGGGAMLWVIVATAPSGASASGEPDFFLLVRTFACTRSTFSAVSTAVPPPPLNHSRIVASSPAPTVDMCPLTMVSGMPSA